MSCDFLALHPPKMHRNSEIILTCSSSKSEDLPGRLGPLQHIHLTSKGQPNRVVIATKAIHTYGSPKKRYVTYGCNSRYVQPILKPSIIPLTSGHVRGLLCRDDDIKTITVSHFL